MFLIIFQKHAQPNGCVLLCCYCFKSTDHERPTNTGK